MATTDTDCPVCACAEIISGKWTLLVIRDLADGNRRFCELERSLDGISPRTLSLRLRALEECGVVERHTWPHDRDGNKRASTLAVLELATRVAAEE